MAGGHGGFYFSNVFKEPLHRVRGSNLCPQLKCCTPGRPSQPGAWAASASHKGRSRTLLRPGELCADARRVGGGQACRLAGRARTGGDRGRGSRGAAQRPGSAAWTPRMDVGIRSFKGRSRLEVMSFHGNKVVRPETPGPGARARRTAPAFGAGGRLRGEGCPRSHRVTSDMSPHPSWGPAHEPRAGAWPPGSAPAGGCPPGQARWGRRSRPGRGGGGDRAGEELGSEASSLGACLLGKARAEVGTGGGDVTERKVLQAGHQRRSLAVEGWRMVEASRRLGALYLFIGTVAVRLSSGDLQRPLILSTPC